MGSRSSSIVKDHSAGTPTCLSPLLPRCASSCPDPSRGSLDYRRHSKKETHSRARLAETVKSGIVEPLTRHSAIDTNKCIGECLRQNLSRTCDRVREKHSGSGGAGPQHRPGVREAACPVEAIQSVFGTEKRGSISQSSLRTAATNVPGIFIAGKLGWDGADSQAGRSGSAGERVHPEKRATMSLMW
jgi:hypothetical protein